MAVFSRLLGAGLRGFLVVLLIATPALLLPGTSTDTTQIVILLGLFAAVLTFFEYASTYPCLFEFRDAPPFNRIRFISLYITVLTLAVIAKGQVAPTVITQLVHAVGDLIGNSIDFPYSPVRLLVLMLPENAPLERLEVLRAAAGIAYLVSLLSLAVFSIAMHLQGWPLQNGSFNVWVNLPTFDPTTGGDVVGRLRRDGIINIVLGFLLPFMMPVVVSSASSLFGAVSLDNPQTMIWTVAAWAFLPASLMMRGIAMSRIASMIADKRRQTTLDAAGMLPA